MNYNFYFTFTLLLRLFIYCGTRGLIFIGFCDLFLKSTMLLPLIRKAKNSIVDCPPKLIFVC
jgi:hypothetical protein